jgi:hypothetical protein
MGAMVAGIVGSPIESVPGAVAVMPIATVVTVMPMPIIISMAILAIAMVFVVVTMLVIPTLSAILLAGP